MQDTGRVGTFSSSSIWRLMTNDKSGYIGKAGLSYIKEKQWEILLGRELVPDKDSRPTSWGTYIENRVFDMLSTSYEMETHKRYVHPDNPFWSGSPDVVVNSASVVGDIKSPWTLSSFCEAVDALGNIEKFKDLKPEWYWQLVSNGILTGKNYAESIVYMPYKKELKEIKRSLIDLPEGQMSRFAFINFLEEDQLPYIPDDNKFYKNLNKWRFAIPLEDTNKLIERVTIATKLLKGEECTRGM